jgi:hypothetical protein
VIDTVWPGKPDLYHAVQATLIPRLPLAPSMATALINTTLTRGEKLAGDQQSQWHQSTASAR